MTITHTPDTTRDLPAPGRPDDDTGTRTLARRGAADDGCAHSVVTGSRWASPTEAL